MTNEKSGSNVSSWASVLLMAATLAMASPPKGAQADLPVKGTEDAPLVLLKLGSNPSSAAAKEADTVVYAGELAAHEGDASVATNKDDVIVANAGRSKTSSRFRFKLPAGHPTGEYTFWARWKQGGDPNVCGQVFEVWAGADETKLELRGKQSLKPSGWIYKWVDGKPLTLKAHDTVLEVRNSGAADNAKVFNAFLLGGPKPPPELAVAGTPEKPVVILAFGKAPLRKPGEDPCILACTGKIVDNPGADSASIAGDSACVRRRGFGEWGATFQFETTEPIPPGYYTFHARYLSGGEVSQVRQTFTVKAGPHEQNLGVRGTFQTVNNKPFQYQWMAGKGTFAIFPGDKVVQVINAGKAHDVKIFSGFELVLDKPAPAWLTAEAATLRGKFMGMLPDVKIPRKWLYLVDGEGAGDKVLFEGLAQDSVRPWYAAARVNYLLGSDGDSLAQRLNLPARPAAVIVDGDQKVLGVLANPASVEQVAQFLSEPGKAGVIPAYTEIKQPEPAALQEGSPAMWLVATGWPGQCGVGQWGLDAETLQRPNPGDVYAYGLYTAGIRSGHWQEKPAEANGLCRIIDRLPDSYAWGKSTSYAVAYIRAVQPVKAVLHLQHSGIKSAVYLDGAEQPLKPDATPPFTLERRKPAAAEKVVHRAGQEIYDDVTVPQAAQGPLAASLDLSTGWHCLVLKLVHAQGKNESVLFAGRLTGADGKPLTGICTQTSDPTAALGMAKAAAGLWPKLTLEGVPGNLPRPGEPLTLVADVRVVQSFISGISVFSFFKSASVAEESRSCLEGPFVHLTIILALWNTRKPSSVVALDPDRPRFQGDNPDAVASRPRSSPTGRRAPYDIDPRTRRVAGLQHALIFVPAHRPSRAAEIGRSSRLAEAYWQRIRDCPARQVAGHSDPWT